MPIKSFNYYQTLEVEDMDIEIQCKDNIREDQFVKGFVPQKKSWRNEIVLGILQILNLLMKT